MLSPYDRVLSDADIDKARHRAMVGGLWEEIGKLQLDFMVAEGGLTPDMKLLDLGCGALRGGVEFIRYLDAGNYYGLDGNSSLIDAGWRRELPEHGLERRLGRDHLLRVGDFGSWRFGETFDRAIAISLWTHLPLEEIERSCWETARVLRPGGALYATIFLCEDRSRVLDPITHDPGGITTYRGSNPFHQTWADMVHIAETAGLDAELVGDWDHPRNQQMVRMSRPTRPRGKAGAGGASTAHPQRTPAANNWGCLSRGVLVLGMHRSGTSALAGSLQEAGLFAGDVVTEAPFNSRGNRENVELRDLNDSVLETSGGAWDRLPARLRWTAEQGSERDRLIGELASTNPVWTFKDPRTLLTLPFWQHGPAELIYAGIFRRPADVVASLRKRGRVNGSDPLDAAQALELWCDFNEMLLTLHRSDPFPLLCFDATGAEFGDQVERAVDLLGQRLGDPEMLSTAAARSFFDDQLIHQRERRDSLEGVGSDLLGRAEGIYTQLRERSLLSG